MRRGRFGLVVAALLAVATSAGCSTGSERAVPPGYDVSREHDVFPEYDNPFIQWVEVTPGSLVDIGLPPLHNDSGQAARVTGMEWLDPPPAITVLTVRAVPYDESDGGIGVASGTLQSLFPTGTPRPVASAVTRPHSDPDWMVLMTVRVSRHTKVGTILFTRARVDYVVGGRTSWQFMHVNVQIRVVRRLPS